LLFPAKLLHVGTSVGSGSNREHLVTGYIARPPQPKNQRTDIENRK